MQGLAVTQISECICFIHRMIPFPALSVVLLLEFTGNIVQVIDRVCYHLPKYSCLYRGLTVPSFCFSSTVDPVFRDHPLKSNSWSLRADNALGKGYLGQV